MNRKSVFPFTEETSGNYSSQMLFDAGARDAEIETLEAMVDHFSSSRACSGTSTKRFGVSVVIATYKGAKRIGHCLRSLEEQDLDTKLFEIILVMNGADDGTRQIVRSFRDDNPHLLVRLVYLPQASAGAARNLGIATARFSYLTMVDDDDYVGTKFLSALLSKASPQRVVIAPIINIDATGREDPNSSQNAKIQFHAGHDFKLASAPSIVGFNACKLFPTEALLETRYLENLASGEDVCFMAAATLRRDFDASVGTLDREGAYFRVLRDDSVSRQLEDFHFAVEQRLAVIRELEYLRTWDNEHGDALVIALSKAQAEFIKRYMKMHPGQQASVTAAIDASGIKDFPWTLINEGTAQHLAISYCFPPYADTSAVVAAKAIVDRGNIVDVIHSDMGNVRTVDSNLKTIAGRFIAHSIEVDSPPSFAGWKEIMEFVSKGIAVAERLNASNGGYRTMYSRVQWPGSHFLAALFKIRHPATVWTAEFSDPLSHDASGHFRPGEIIRDQMFDFFSRSVAGKGYALPKSRSLFVWCEFLAYVLADELIFTNENQLQFMLTKIPDAKLRKWVLQKAIVRPHPTPPAESYTLVRSDYPLVLSRFNIAYFGNFYDNRALHEVFTALINAPVDVRSDTRLHIFTNETDKLARTVDSLGLTEIVVIESYRPYFEFLSLTKRFDVLLVNDVMRTEHLEINPFLPSKYSDYLGSGRPIWGLLDDESPLSKQPLAYKSPVGDAVSALAIIRRMHADWLSSRGKDV